MLEKGTVPVLLKHLPLVALAILVLVVMFVATGCGNKEATPTLTPTKTPTPSPTALHVEVIIYGDFQCPKCANLFFNVEEELLKLYGNTSKVSIEFRPINGLGDESLLAAEAALCAKDQGKFWEYSSALYTAWRRDGKGAYSQEELIKTAMALGLDEQAFSSCLKSGAKAAKVEAYKQALVDLGETEIPMTYINGHKIRGLQPLQTFVDYIQGLLTNMSTSIPKVEVIIYSDFQCANCAELFFNVEEELQRLYGNTSTVSIEIRPTNGLGDASLLAGEAALCAKDQGKFWEYSSALYTAWRRDGKSAYSEDELIKTAIALGLNEEAFSSCLKTGTKAAQVEANKQALEDTGETEIPIVFINDNKIKGDKPLQTYVDFIEWLLTK
jgi:protein-disulfide isomerase